MANWKPFIVKCIISYEIKSPEDWERFQEGWRRILQKSKTTTHPNLRSIRRRKQDTSAGLPVFCIALLPDEKKQFQGETLAEWAEKEKIPLFD